MLRILLVDDEPLVLIGLQGMLEWEKLGYTVSVSYTHLRAHET